MVALQQINVFRATLDTCFAKEPSPLRGITSEPHHWFTVMPSDHFRTYACRFLCHQNIFQFL